MHVSGVDRSCPWMGRRPSLVYSVRVLARLHLQRNIQNVVDSRMEYGVHVASYQGVVTGLKVCDKRMCMRPPAHARRCMYVQHLGFRVRKGRGLASVSIFNRRATGKRMGGRKPCSLLPCERGGRAGYVHVCWDQGVPNAELGVFSRGAVHGCGCSNRARSWDAYPRY
jgi:hypothetical protein